MDQPQPHYHRCTFGCSDGLSLDSLVPRSRGICGDRSPLLDVPGEMPLAGSVCTLLAEHFGWHQDDYGMSWTPSEELTEVNAA